MAVSLVLTTSCHLFIPDSEPLTHQSSVASECRVVRHLLGETCVPVKPKRVVALDAIRILDPLLAIDIKPVGTAADDWRGKRYWGGLSRDEVQGIEVIGQTHQPSLEKLLMVKPDLILGLTDSAQYYQQLSAIAPTVLFDFDKEVKFSFKEHLRAIARIVGREANAEDAIARYQKRIETLKAQIGDRLEGKEVSVIYHSDGTFWIQNRYAVFFEILTDLGIRLKPILLEDSLNLIPAFSIEAIHRYDADILFICDDDGRPKSFFLKNPLLSSLKAAQNQQLYIVDGNIWRAHGPSVINKIVDDLFKYLLKTTQTL
ncbi:MAG: iron-siderophore ABC transporter substrate-binding protein [Hydrococcus sp. Prado102]|jgi:iron complex transport system substrate-binding protein|nr:iron-siderophore ABC transporter substrate-binding protein [Hydrococcus sp. Prado102]